MLFLLCWKSIPLLAILRLKSQSPRYLQPLSKCITAENSGEVCGCRCLRLPTRGPWLTRFVTVVCSVGLHQHVWTEPTGVGCWPRWVERKVVHRGWRAGGATQERCCVTEFWHKSCVPVFWHNTVCVGVFRSSPVVLVCCVIAQLCYCVLTLQLCQCVLEVTQLRYHALSKHEGQVELNQTAYTFVLSSVIYSSSISYQVPGGGCGLSSPRHGRSKLNVLCSCAPSPWLTLRHGGHPSSFL